MRSNSVMNERALQTLFKSLTHLVWFNGTEEEVGRLEYTLSFLAKYYGQGWDRAERIDILI